MLKACKDEAGKRGLGAGFFSRAGGESGNERNFLRLPGGWRCGASGWSEESGVCVVRGFGKES